MSSIGRKSEETVDVVHRRVEHLPPSRRRVVVAVISGSLFIIAGLIVPVPGPFSLVLFAMGLTVLSWEFEFAQKARKYINCKLDKARTAVVHLKEKVRTR